MEEHTPPELELLLRYIAQERGIDCRKYKTNFLERRLASRMRAHHVSDYQSYLYILKKHPEELDALLDNLTINLTYFFRDQSVFEALRKEVLAPLIRERDHPGRRQLRLWSAGCATGEEPYSLAILLHQLLGAGLSHWDITLLATDLDEKALAKARAGVYDAFSFREVSAQELSPYFTIQNGRYHLVPEVKSLVTFQRHDLLGDSYPSNMDVILCRNVLIYFTREQHDYIFTMFHRALKDGGVLVTGKTEIMLGPLAACFKAVNLREHIYRKVGGAVPSRPPASS
jgi:chemotaxis protein methyltransferase CheR